MERMNAVDANSGHGNTNNTVQEGGVYLLQRIGIQCGGPHIYIYIGEAKGWWPIKKAMKK